jgi:hypothetical protein
MSSIGGRCRKVNKHKPCCTSGAPRRRCPMLRMGRIRPFSAPLERSTLSRVKFLSRVLTALNLLDESSQLAREWIGKNASDLGVSPLAVAEGSVVLHLK